MSDTIKQALHIPPAMAYDEPSSDPEATYANEAYVNGWNACRAAALASLDAQVQPILARKSICNHDWVNRDAIEPWLACCKCGVRYEDRNDDAPVQPASKPEVEQPNLVLALPIYEKRRIVIVDDEMVEGERLVSVAIRDAAPVASAAPVQPASKPEVVGYEMVHATGSDRGFSWKLDNPLFGKGWTAIPLTRCATSSKEAAPMAAIKDALLYGTGAYIQKPNGESEHIPLEQMYKDAPISKEASDAAQDGVIDAIDALAGDAQPHPLEGLHINQGSFDAASDAYAAEYWQAKFEKTVTKLGGPFTDLSKDANGNYNDKFAFYAYIGWQWRGNEHAAAPVQPASKPEVWGDLANGRLFTDAFEAALYNKNCYPLVPLTRCATSSKVASEPKQEASDKEGA